MSLIAKRGPPQVSYRRAYLVRMDITMKTVPIYAKSSCV